MKELATALELYADDLEEIAEFDEENITYSDLGDWFMNSGSSEIQYIAFKLRQIAKGINE